MKKLFVFLLLIILLTACASIENGNGIGLSLQEAIDQSVEKIAAELPAGSRVAIVAFSSPNNSLSHYIMEELTGAFIDSNIEVADRQNLEYVYEELNFNMSGNVSDESAQSIGKFLGAQLVITGELTSIGSTYRFRTSAIIVEKATRAHVSRFNVRDDKAMRDMVTTLANQRNTPNTRNYSVSEDTTPRTAGTFLDRGILFASRGNYAMAIEDFTSALNKDANFGAAFLLRGRAILASVLMVSSIEENFSGFTATSTLGNASASQRQAFEQAIEDFNQAVRIDPNNARIYMIRGNAYSEKGDQDRAIADLNRAIQLNPNYINAYFNRGIAYYIKGDYDRAISDYSQAIRLSPNDVDLYNARSLAYYYKNDIRQAIIDLESVLRLDPNNIQAKNNLDILQRN